MSCLETHKARSVFCILSYVCTVGFHFHPFPFSLQHWFMFMFGTSTYASRPEQAAGRPPGLRPAATVQAADVLRQNEPYCQRGRREGGQIAGVSLIQIRHNVPGRRKAGVCTRGHGMTACGADSGGENHSWWHNHCAMMAMLLPVDGL